MVKFNIPTTPSKQRITLKNIENEHFFPLNILDVDSSKQKSSKYED